MIIRRAAMSREDGSIPLTLIVIILVGGVIAALVTAVVGTQRTVRFDRSYSEAITGADAGLQQALTYLSTREYSTLPNTVDSTTLTLDDELGNATIAWTATKSSGAGWEVRASGQVADVERVVESSLEQDRFFVVGAFGDQSVDMVGNNYAKSYPASGQGSIGSNGTITFRGNTHKQVDVVYRYGPDSHYTCSGSDCPTVNTTDDPYDVDAVESFVQDQMSSKCTDEELSEVKTLSDEASDTDGDGFYELSPGTVICADTFTFDVDLEIPGATVDPPVEIFTKNRVNFSKKVVVNCEICIGDSPSSIATPVSGALRVNTLGDIFIGNQSELAGAFLAPSGFCQPENSGAQTEIYGSLVCRTLGDGSGLQGGWKFYFDTDLLNLGSGSLEITRYREEAPGTTSFD